MPTGKKAAKGAAGHRPGSLDKYQKMRDFAQTPEPAGVKKSRSKRLLFVIQKHSATRLHYDFRLEADGVLASWAVPKGPTLVPGDKRLAMHVEDHPMDYREFEGVIPKGQYGAGQVIVWDEGTYELAEGDDPAEEIAGGKIKFIMHGEKMRGMFSLVRIKPREGESGDPWLLIKDRDGNDPTKYDINDYPKSVKTGRTIEDIRKEKDPATWQSRPKGSQSLPDIDGVELATTVDEPFDGDDWLFELKWDGYRAICSIDMNHKLKLTSRNGIDLLKQFPDLADLAHAFKHVPIIVDGEIVALDSHGHSKFERLQEYPDNRAQLTYVAFDLLYAQGRDLRKVALEERKALLEKEIVDDSIVLYSKHVAGKGKALFAQVKKAKLEGIIGKKRDSLYYARRTRDWVKIKAQLEQEFVVGGWTDPKGSRKGFGSLLLGVYEGKDLRFVGSVGTGFTVKRITELAKKLASLERKTSPFVNEVVANSGIHYVKPELVAQVRFTEWTRDSYLRHPAFLGLRTDKPAKTVSF